MCFCDYIKHKHNNNNCDSSSSNRPDMIIVFPNDKKAFLVDMAIPGDSRQPSKVLEKQICYILTKRLKLRNYGQLDV